MLLTRPLSSTWFGAMSKRLCHTSGSGVAAGCAGVCGVGAGVCVSEGAGDWAYAGAASPIRSPRAIDERRRMFGSPRYRMKNWPDGWFEP